MCIFSTSNKALILRQHRQIHNESFYTVWCRTAQSPVSLGSSQPGSRHVYIIGKWSSSTNPRPEWRRLTIRVSYCWQMHDAESPPTPSLHLHTARTKGWELLIGRCHEWQPLHKQAALLGAPPQLLWQQTSCWAGCKAANLLCASSISIYIMGFKQKKRKIALYLGAFHAGIKRVELKTGLIYLCRSYSRTAHLSREDDNIRPKLLTGVCLYGSDYDHWIKLQSQHKQKLLLHVQHCLLTY